MKRVEFKLSMPNPPSWNGKWSLAELSHTVVRKLQDDVAVRIVKVARYSHHWDDGWHASIEVRIMEPGERQKKSAGFAGYDWMIDNIIAHGSASPKEEVA